MTHTDSPSKKKARSDTGRVKRVRNRDTTATQPTRQRHAVTFHDKLMILRVMRENGWTQGMAAKHFQKNGFPHITQGSISYWQKHEAEYQDYIAVASHHKSAC